MELLKVGDRTLQAPEIMPLLSQFGLLPRLVQEVLIDTAIVDIELTEAEANAAEVEFCRRNQITSPEDAKTWAQQRYGTPDMVKTVAQREMRLSKFKTASFEKEVDSYFLQRKSRLDRVLYSLIRTQQPGLAQELYFRIHDDGHAFAELAREYSEGQEAKTGGLIGPVELSVPHPSLAGLLSVSQPGQVWPPKRIGEWYVIVRLEKFFPAQLDDAMRQRLQDELFQQWLKEQLQSVPITVMAATAPTASAEVMATATVPAGDRAATGDDSLHTPPLSPQDAAPEPPTGNSFPEPSTADETSPDPAEADPWS